MKKHTRLATAFIITLAASGSLLADSQPGLLEKAKQSAGEATDWTKEKARQGWEATKEGAGKAADWTADKAEKGADATAKGVNKAVDWTTDKAKDGTDWTKEKSQGLWEKTKEFFSDDKPKNKQ